MHILTIHWSLVEKRRLVKALAADLSKINQNKDARGINRVKEEARERGEDPEAAAATWRAANPNLKRAGGRPKKGSKSVRAGSKRSRADSGIVDTPEEAHDMTRNFTN